MSYRRKHSESSLTHIPWVYLLCARLEWFDVSVMTNNAQSKNKPLHILRQEKCQSGLLVRYSRIEQVIYNTFSPFHFLELIYSSNKLQSCVG